MPLFFMVYGTSIVEISFVKELHIREASLKDTISYVRIILIYFGVLPIATTRSYGSNGLVIE